MENQNILNKQFKILKLSLTLLFFLSFFFLDNSLVLANENSPDIQINALLETADAYYRQREQLQYDSYRKNLLSSPEDATSQHYVYTVCSGLVFQVYYQTLGIEIPDTTEELLEYAKSNVSYKDNILAYYSDSNTIYSNNVLGTLETPNYTNLIKEWTKFVKPGDIIVVTGHCWIISSVNRETGKIEIIEAAAGGRYDFKNHVELYDEVGTIVYTDLDYRLKTYYNRLKNNNTLIEEMAIIRFVTDGNSYINLDNQKDTYVITEAAKSRLKFPKIDIEKTLTIKNKDIIDNQTLLVDLSENITYKIVIKNSSNIDYESFPVVENIDSNTQLIDNGNGTLENGKLKWTIPSLKAGESVTLTYTIKIPDNKDFLGKTIVSSGFVDNIATSKIETFVGDKLDKEQITKITNSFTKLKDNNLAERNFINEIYKDALGIDLGISEIKNLDIISFDSNIKYGQNSLSIKGTKINNTNVSKYIFNNFYGLRIGSKDVAENNVVRAILQWNLYPTYENYDRARTISSNMLLNGDIILCYLGKENSTDNELVDKSYIYLNNKLIRKKSSNDFEELTGEEMTVFLRNLVGENYMILRPSISLNNIVEEPSIDTEEINKDNNIEDNILENPKTGQFFVAFTVILILVISILFIYIYGLRNKINKK